jgi:hypothetical protein
MAVGVYLFYGATRGRVLPLLAAIGKERIVWTRIVATVLFLLGAMVFVSACSGSAADTALRTACSESRKRDLESGIAQSR